MKNIKKLEGAELKQVEALVPLLKEGAARSQEMIAKITGQKTRSPPTATAQPAEHRHRHRLRRVRQADDYPQWPPGKIPGLCSGYPKCKNTAEVPAKPSRKWA